MSKPCPDAASAGWRGSQVVRQGLQSFIAVDSAPRLTSGAENTGLKTAENGRKKRISVRCNYKIVCRGTTLHLNFCFVGCPTPFLDGQNGCPAKLYLAFARWGSSAAGETIISPQVRPGGISTDTACPFSHSVHANQLGLTAATVTTALESLGTQTYRPLTPHQLPQRCFQTILNR